MEHAVISVQYTATTAKRGKGKAIRILASTNTLGTSMLDLPDFMTIGT
jgi:hypothetical protein